MGAIEFFLVVVLPEAFDFAMFKEIFSFGWVLVFFIFSLAVDRDGIVVFFNADLMPTYWILATRFGSPRMKSL